MTRLGIYGNLEYLTLPTKTLDLENDRTVFGLPPFAYKIQIILKLTQPLVVQNYDQVACWADGYFVAGLSQEDNYIYSLEHNGLVAPADLRYVCRMLSIEWREVDCHFYDKFIIFTTQTYPKEVLNASSYFPNLFRRMNRWLKNGGSQEEMVPWTSFEKEVFATSRRAIHMRTSDCLSIEQILAAQRSSGGSLNALPTLPHVQHCNYCNDVMRGVRLLLLKECAAYKKGCLLRNEYTGEEDMAFIPWNLADFKP